MASPGPRLNFQISMLTRRAIQPVLRALLVLLAAAIGPATRAAADDAAERLWALELSGGSVLLSLDAPEERGAVFVFHRSPDGVFSSVRAADVRRISVARAAAAARKPRREWETLVLGRDAEGPDRGAGEPGAGRAPAAAAPSPDAYGGYGGWSWGWAGAVVPSPPHRPPPLPPGRVPPLVRPNGFPAVGPPASPGSGTLPIGPNGFPILGLPVSSPF